MPERSGALRTRAAPGPARTAWRIGGTGCAVLVGLVVVLSRLPFLGRGYGSDPDAWRAISAARHLLETGRYVPSRVPGYPLPEYFDALMLHVGAGSALGIGLVSALLSGVAAALFVLLLMPLGRARAVAGALALSFTPVVYVAGLGAMDYLWGLAFFLAATLCTVSRRAGLAALFLGLAAASRPSYALAFIPLGLLCVDFEPAQLRLALPRRRLFVLAAGSGLIALAFFLPAFATVGVQVPRAYGGWEHVVVNSSVGLFGAAGLLGVGWAVVSAWRGRRGPVPLSDGLGGNLDRWAVTVLIVYGLLFVRLPDEASYLLPALPGLYWLLCRYARDIALWVLTAALLLSCFVFSVNRDSGAVGMTLRGPVLREIGTQEDRDCVANVVRRKLAASPDGLDLVIAGASRPQLLVELGAPLSDRVLYTVRPGADGTLVDTEGVVVPRNARLLLLDRAADQQSELWQIPEGLVAVLDSGAECGNRD